MGLVPVDKTTRERLLKLQIPEVRAACGWKIDYLAVCHAIEELQLKLPVRIRYMAGKNRMGSHYGRDDLHLITLNHWEYAEQANQTLWHELAHAHQTEVWAKFTGKPHSQFYTEAYKQAAGAYGASYRDNKFEIHANEFAEANCHVKLIVE